MYERILVPLDGSSQAEIVLPYVYQLAAKLRSELVIVSVAEPLASQAGLSYLNEGSQKLKAQKFSVSIEVTSGSPADRILEHAEANGIDLIAMSTHGRSGIGRWVFGSVTDKVLHSGDIAIFVVRATQS